MTEAACGSGFTADVPEMSEANGAAMADWLPFTVRGPAGVLFAEDFDMPAQPRHGSAPEIIVPAFSAEELEAARQQAWQEGQDAAACVAAQADHAATRSAVMAIAAAVADARSHALALAEAAAEQIALLLMDGLALALPALCARHGDAELRAVIATLLPSLSVQPAVLIRLNPCNRVTVMQELEQAAPDLAAQVQLVTSDSVAPGDACVSWQAGQAVRDVTSLWTQVAAVLVPATLLSPGIREDVHVRE